MMKVIGLIDVLLGIVVCLVSVILMFKRHGQREDIEENRHLNSNQRHVRRSSTYYSWNKTPVQQKKQSDDHNTWENKREELLKKYAREPSRSS